MQLYLANGQDGESIVSALKKVAMRMRPECHPASFFDMVYIPERGGDVIHVKCLECYRVFLKVKLPKERGNAD